MPGWAVDMDVSHVTPTSTYATDAYASACTQDPAGAYAAPTSSGAHEAAAASSAPAVPVPPQRRIEIKPQENGRIAIKVVDSETGDTVREVPDEHLLAALRKLAEVAGAIFDEAA